MVFAPEFRRHQGKGRDEARQEGEVAVTSDGHRVPGSHPGWAGTLWTPNPGSGAMAGTPMLGVAGIAALAVPGHDNQGKTFALGLA
jgi:hypothetical protein